MLTAAPRRTRRNAFDGPLHFLNHHERHSPHSREAGSSHRPPRVASMKPTSLLAAGLGALLALSAADAANCTASDISSLSSLPEAEALKTACVPTTTASSNGQARYPCSDAACRRAVEKFSTAMPDCEVNGTKFNTFYFTQFDFCENEALGVSVRSASLASSPSAAATTATVVGALAVVVVVANS